MRTVSKLTRLRGKCPAPVGRLHLRPRMVGVGGLDWARTVCTVCSGWGLDREACLPGDTLQAGLKAHPRGLLLVPGCPFLAPAVSPDGHEYKDGIPAPGQPRSAVTAFWDESKARCLGYSLGAGGVGTSGGCDFTSGSPGTHVHTHPHTQACAHDTYPQAHTCTHISHTHTGMCTCDTHTACDCPVGSPCPALSQHGSPMRTVVTFSPFYRQAN